MIVVEPQEVEIGQTITSTGKKLLVKELFTDGTKLRMHSPQFIMSTKRGYYLLEESNE